MISPRQALERLQEGNRRFVAGRNESAGRKSSARREEVVAAQDPFAILLGCSDSRVPAEMIFDLGLGDLFVIRVAGNIITPAQAGSIEFCVKQLGTQLIVILGHSDCGAIRLALEELEGQVQVSSPNLRAILDRIQPALDRLLRESTENHRATLLREAVMANVRASVEELRRTSPLIQQQSSKGDLLIVGAKYSLDSGIVDFFDGLPGDSEEQG